MFRVQGFRIWASGFRGLVSRGLGFRGSGFRVWGGTESLKPKPCAIPAKKQPEGCECGAKPHSTLLIPNSELSLGVINPGLGFKFQELFRH